MEINAYIYPEDLSDDLDTFRSSVSEQVRRGNITREPSDFSIDLSMLRDEFRPIAEAELEKQGK